MIGEPQRESLADHEPALYLLLSIYRQREDLQSTFPEARDWDFRRLVGWAARVCTGEQQDSARADLAGYADWFKANRVDDSAGPDVVPWDEWQRCWRAAQFHMPGLCASMQDFTRTAFNQHLTTMAMMVAELNLQRIVEVGTQYGHSTLALLEGAQRAGGHVFSIDVEPCSEAKSKVEAAGLARHWTFIEGNALNIRPPVFSDQIDLLFIDTFHLYSQTKRELEHFERYLAPSAWIVLHDAITFPGVTIAVREFLERRPGRFRFYPFIHQHGLLLLKAV